MYSPELLDHFLNPRNLGRIDNADGTGLGGDPGCGDYVRLFIRVEGEILRDIKFEVQGCPAAIATASVFSEMVRGRSLIEALDVTNEEVAGRLGGLTAEKMHCSNLATSALIQAVWSYFISGRADKSLMDKVFASRRRGG